MGDDVTGVGDVAVASADSTTSAANDSQHQPLKKTLMKKKDETRFTLKFCDIDPRHQIATETLNAVGRRKASFVADAVCWYLAHNGGAMDATALHRALFANGGVSKDELFMQKNGRSAEGVMPVKPRTTSEPIHIATSDGAVTTSWQAVRDGANFEIADISAAGDI